MVFETDAFTQKLHVHVFPLALKLDYLKAAMLVTTICNLAMKNSDSCKCQVNAAADNVLQTRHDALNKSTLIVFHTLQLHVVLVFFGIKAKMFCRSCCWVYAVL